MEWKINLVQKVWIDGELKFKKKNTHCGSGSVACELLALKFIFITPNFYF
jgi:hypothetical protein